MGDNIPSGSLARKRSKRKYDKTKLPTPPPDPQPNDDLIAYLDSLPKAPPPYFRSASFSPALATEDAFDHLEKLYRLMEQMLELREQNAKLHRRVRDLEHLNNLEKMRREIDSQVGVGEECPELEKDTAFAETILESILAEAKTPKRRISLKRRQRQRSGSMSAAPRSPDPSELHRGRRTSMGPLAASEAAKKPAKVSKWTKVKAAFKWERASPNVATDARSQDSGLCSVGAAPSPNPGAALEATRYLRVPSFDEHGHSPADSGAGAEVSTPGSLSTASSAEDFHRNENRCDDLRSSEDEHSHSYIPHSKEGSQKSKGKTPWAKMKGIISTRNSFKKKRLSSHSDDIQIDVEVCSDEEVFEDEEKEKKKVPEDIVARYQKISSEDAKSSKWTRVKKAFLPPKEEEKEERSIEDEIQKNYRQLQKKLSLEFQEKLTEWERMKQNSPSSPSSTCGVEESKDKMKKPEDLPLEFRKKLQEWEKIRKCSKKKLGEVRNWKSLKNDPMDYNNLSEDFRKKLEEWKQIKAGQSPKQTRKESVKKKNELQWFEKELTKIEKEKQRLERERQKFLEREESLSKLRNSVVGGLKKEVLIHTPSGFYRFEGISRKFTQKLYEWEKAQGIGPESSTFALLNSSLQEKEKTKSDSPPIMRSKSADSIAVPPCSLMSPQPSSLSLNNVEELEKEVLGDSRSSSCQFLTQSRQFSIQDEPEDEPEALIVEIEDIVEETAAPLLSFAQERPIYRQEAKIMCEGETCAAPKIERSESAKAQINYNLIEEIFSILKNLLENEAEIEKSQEMIQEKEEEEERNLNLIRLKMYDESQKAMSVRLSEKISRLQEANSSVFVNLAKEEEFSSNQLLESLESVQDLSSEIGHLAEKLNSEVTNRDVYENEESGARCLNPITETSKEMKKKILELRRRLSYLCAASDVTAPPSSKKKAKKTSSDGRLYKKAENPSHQNQGAIKKRIKHRQKKVPDSEEEDENEANKHKKLTRSRSAPTNEVMVDESIVQKVVVPTQVLNVTGEEEEKTDSPVTVFVKTTRKLFTPIVESALNSQIQKNEEKEDMKSEEKKEETVARLPPLPSPILPRKAKEISPSIRLMITKYNQKLEDSGVKSGNSSGSASPVWRSPKTERRVKAQTEKYQEELNKTQIQNFPSEEEERKRRPSSELRLQKLQKAKEEFLNSTPGKEIKARNRLSQVSFDSDNDHSEENFMLIKSASAGMINVDYDVYRQIDPEVHGGGYVSLPRNVKKQKEEKGRFGFANIAAKFRKVKMKKGKMNAVATLCRQSLLVDIGGQVEEKDNEDKDKNKEKKRGFFKK